MQYSDKEKKFLLQIARESIEHYLRNNEIMDVEPGKIPSERLIEDGACFVSIHGKINHELRGCMGMLEATRPLVKDIVNNAIAAAVQDPRFPPLSQEELEGVKISISVLTKPQKFKVKNYRELLEKLVSGKHGLIIQKGWAKATFLPVVWEQLPEKEEFLGHLCMKAGLGKEEWKEPGMEFLIYEAIEFEE